LSGDNKSTGSLNEDIDSVKFGIIGLEVTGRFEVVLKLIYSMPKDKSWAALIKVYQLPDSVAR
jgi:hypothetical protein